MGVCNRGWGGQIEGPGASGNEGTLGPTKAHYHFTGDTVEVWVGGALPWVPGKETAAESGAGPRSRPKGSKCQVSEKDWGHFSEKISPLRLLL